MQCRRCEGTGTLTIRLGKPGHDRHAAYKGLWCVFPSHSCGVCRGTGKERDKPPPRPYRGPIQIRDPETIEWS